MPGRSDFLKENDTGCCSIAVNTVHDLIRRGILNPTSVCIEDRSFTSVVALD